MESNGHVDFDISIVARAEDTDARRESFRSFLSHVSEGMWARQVMMVREAYAVGGKDAAARHKRALPAALFSGRFSSRSDAGLMQHSGLICVDLDELGPQLESVRDLIAADECTLAAFVSPTGTGLKVIYRCDPSKPHLESYRAAERYVLEHFGLEIDKACKNVSRLCYASHDPEAFTAGDAVPLTYPPKEVEFSSANPAKSAALSGLTPGDDYDQRGQVPALLLKHGWTKCGRTGWRRPDKSDGISATWDHIPNRLFVFSSSTSFEADHVYRPWHVYAILECGGDFGRAGKELYALGFGERMKAVPSVEPLEVEWGDDPPPVAPNGIHSPKPTRRSIGDFKLVMDGDRSVLLGNRYLNRGDGGVLAGTSGIGKSSLALFMAVLWSMGRPALGIKPNGKLRSLILQSEDSDGDVAEVWASLIHCLKLTPEEEAVVRSSVHLVTDRVNRGLEFRASLKAHLAEFKPDLVWINPLQAFAKGDITKGEALGEFLREQLNSLNEPPAFGYIIVHHTTKPATGKDRAERLWHEVMYDMAGGAEIINWARFIMSLRPAEKEGDLNLVLAKRGRRAGVTRQVEQGAGFILEPVTSIPIRHATGRLEVPGIVNGLPIIFWEEREPDKPKEREGAQRGGRPPAHEFNDYRDLFPPHEGDGLVFDQLLKLLGRNGDIKRSSLQSALKRWEKEGQVERISKRGDIAKFRLSAFISKGSE